MIMIEFRRVMGNSFPSCKHRVLESPDEGVLQLGRTMRRSFNVSFVTEGPLRNDGQVESSIVLIRAPIMPMLLVDGIEYAVLKAPFRCPLKREDVSGRTAAPEATISAGKTLGCRRRYGLPETILRYRPQSEERDVENEPTSRVEEPVRDGCQLVLWQGEDGYKVVVDPRLSAVLREHQR